MELSGLFSLTGRTALVTGGSGGLGPLIASGAQVYVYSRKADHCEQAAREVGPNCVAFSHNISTLDGCRALTGAVRVRETKLDILVNNVDIAWGTGFESFPENGWEPRDGPERQGAVLPDAGALPAARGSCEAGSSAKVINIGSIDGLRLNSRETYSYQASKAAIFHLTRRPAARLVSDHIHVTAIAAAAFASLMNRADEDREDKVAQGIPAGRIDRAEEIGAAAIISQSARETTSLAKP